jgi:hypothetical protein
LTGSEIDELIHWITLSEEETKWKTGLDQITFENEVLSAWAGQEMSVEFTSGTTISMIP